LALRADRDDLAAGRRGDGAAGRGGGERRDDGRGHGEQEDGDGAPPAAARRPGPANTGPADPACAAAHATLPANSRRPGTSSPDLALMIIVSIISKQPERGSRQHPPGRRPW